MYTEVVVHLMEVVLKTIPNNCILYIGHSINDACEANYLSGISDYIVGIDKNIKSVYRYAILLSKECIAYLISEFSSEPESLAFLTHYCIVKNNICYLQVLDSSIINILDTIQIPDKLLSECKSISDIYLYLDNHVRNSFDVFSLNSDNLVSASYKDFREIAD